MRPFRFPRHALAATLFAGAAATLIGCQQLVTLSPAAAPEAQTTPAFRALETQKATFVNAAFMTAAAPSASFEAQYVKPTSVPTAAPTAAPAAPVAPVTEAPKQSAEPVVAKVAEPEQEIASFEAPKMLVYESGIASTYGNGDGFEG